MVKPLRSAFMAGVVLTEFHHHGYRVLSIWLRMCAADVAWYKPSRYRATIRGGWGLMSPEAGGDAIESLRYDGLRGVELGRQNFNGLLLFNGLDVPLTFTF